MEAPTKAKRPPTEAPTELRAQEAHKSLEAALKPRVQSPQVRSAAPAAKAATAGEAPTQARPSLAVAGQEVAGQGGLGAAEASGTLVAGEAPTTLVALPMHSHIVAEIPRRATVS